MCISSTRGPLNLRLCSVTLYCTVHWIWPLFINVCSLAEHTHSHTASLQVAMNCSLSLSHTHTQYSHNLLKCYTVFNYFQPSHRALCVKDSYSWTHIVNNSDQRTNMPWRVWVSFYLFKSYHRRMYSIITVACQNTVLLCAHAGGALLWPSDLLPAFLTCPDHGPRYSPLSWSELGWVTDTGPAEDLY